MGKAANDDIAEAETHCKWLEKECPKSCGTYLLRAKLLLATGDDFQGAHAQLLEAQKLAPDDRRVQGELRKVKIDLRKSEEEQSQNKVVDLRDRLKKAREYLKAASAASAEGARETNVELLKELAEVKCSWDVVME